MNYSSYPLYCSIHISRIRFSWSSCCHLSYMYTSVRLYHIQSGRLSDSQQSFNWTPKLCNSRFELRTYNYVRFRPFTCYLLDPSVKSDLACMKRYSSSITFHQHQSYTVSRVQWNSGWIWMPWIARRRAEGPFNVGKWPGSCQELCALKIESTKLFDFC